nr:ABC transporter permease subunit [Limosilactobacillus antri]
MGYYPIIGLNEVTLSYYREVLHDHYFVQSLLYSLYLGLLATVGALVLGLLMALILERVAGRHRFLARLFAVPITIPHIIVALMIMQLLSQSGLISRLAIHLHLITSIDDFPLLVNDRWGIAIIVVFLYKEIPYVAVTMLAILRQLRGSYTTAARNLGASRWQAFWHVTLPLIQPTLCTLFIILFCFTFANFEVPYILGNPSNETIALTIYNQFLQPDLQSRPAAFALNTILSLFCLAVTLLALLLSRLLPGGKDRYVK